MSRFRTRPRSDDSESDRRGQGRRATIRQERRRRIRALATPEVVLACAIAAAWALGAATPLLPAAIVTFIVLLTISVNLMTVDSGSFSLLWITTGWVLLLIVVSVRTVLASASPLLFTAAGVSALVHNELIRLGFARRRNAAVDRSAFVSSAIGIGLASLLAIIGIGLGEPVAATVGRTWLWMPITVALVTLLAVAFVVVPTFRAPTAHKDRWQPGDRLPPRQSRRFP